MLMIRSLHRSISSPQAEQDEEDGFEEDEKDYMMCRSQRRIYNLFMVVLWMMMI